MITFVAAMAHCPDRSIMRPAFDLPVQNALSLVEAT